MHCKKRIKVLVLFIFLPVTLYAGEYAAEFLRIGVGARALGMGGAYVALANDGTAVFWNPAGLAQINALQLSFTHAPMFNGLAQHNFASAALKIARNTAIALSWIRLEVDDIPRYGALPGTPFDRIRDPRLRSTGEAEGYLATQSRHFYYLLDADLNSTWPLVEAYLPLSFHYEFHWG
ncbi:MAG: hypothetical protein ACE5HX_06410 [bacterium]